MPAAKKKSPNLASLLIADRFSGKLQSKKFIPRNSVTEFSPLMSLNEKLLIENKKIYNSKFAPEGTETLQSKYSELIDSIDYTVSIPPRIPYGLIDSQDYPSVECFIFNRWKYEHSDHVFERNIEIWRQFWIACERATTIAQIVDARDPVEYLNSDIFKLYPEKNHLLLINKADLASRERLDQFVAALGGIPVHIYSATASRFDFGLTGTVALIGYPNVGKSSTINMILSKKRVSVSATPGKTKFIQTIETPEFTLLDCPGLVFPRHSKIELMLMGILNIDQTTDLSKYEHYVVEKIGVERLMRFYKVSEFTGEFLTAMSAQKGWVKSGCLKRIAKDYAMGVIQ